MRNLEKNIQEFKRFLAGEYDQYLVTPGDQFAGWNYFTENYFDCLEYKEKEEVFFHLLLDVYDVHLMRALGYTQWLISPPKTYLGLFCVFIGKETTLMKDKKRFSIIYFKSLMMKMFGLISMMSLKTKK